VRAVFELRRACRGEPFQLSPCGGSFLSTCLTFL
jgi:hypothetical protein